MGPRTRPNHTYDATARRPHSPLHRCSHDALIRRVSSARCTGRAEARSARDRLTHQHTLASYNAPTQTHDTRHTTRYRVGTRGTAGRHALPEHGAPRRRRVVHTKNLELCAPAGWRSSGSHSHGMGARGAGREALFATRGEGLCTRVKRGWGEPSGAVSRPAPRGQEGPRHSSQEALLTVAKHPSALPTTPLGAVRTLAL